MVYDHEIRNYFTYLFFIIRINNINNKYTLFSFYFIFLIKYLFSVIYLF